MGKKKNRYLNKATSQKAAELINEGNYRTAARLIGNRIDPAAPMAAGRKAMSQKVRARADKAYVENRTKARSSGRVAAKEIAAARKASRNLRRLDQAIPQGTMLMRNAKVANSTIVKRSLTEARYAIGLGKLAKSHARSSGVFGIAAMVANHLAGEVMKKKRG